VLAGELWDGRSDSDTATPRQNDTYSLTADIWVPQLCLERHLRRSEWVFLRNFDVHYICASFIRCIWWSWKGCMQMRQIRTSICCFCQYLRLDIALDICQLLGNAADPVRSHGDRVRGTIEEMCFGTRLCRRMDFWCCRRV